MFDREYHTHFDRQPDNLIFRAPLTLGARLTTIVLALCHTSFRASNSQHICSGGVGIHPPSYVNGRTGHLPLRDLP